MRFAVGFCIPIVALLNFVAAAPDPEVVKRYNAITDPELTRNIGGIQVRYKLSNKGNDLVEGTKKQKADSELVLAGWLKNPVLSEGSTLFPKKSNIPDYLVRLDLQGGYGSTAGRYGNFQVQINGVVGKKSSIGSVQIAIALTDKKPVILTDLMTESVTRTLGVFVNPATGL